MPKPPPSELDFIALFECEPTFSEPSSEALHRTLTFKTERQGYLVQFEISPLYSSLNASVSRDGIELSRVDMSAFNALEIVDERGQEMLVAQFGEMDERTMWLTLKPHVRLAIST